MPEKYKETSCSCEECVDMCRRPCWPTPEETIKLIEHGYANRLMLDYWVGDNTDGGDIPVICPASEGYEGRIAPFMPFGKCAFLTEDNLCELHDEGLKPFEGRMASCKETDPNLHWDLASKWRGQIGRDIQELWESKLKEKQKCHS